MTNPKKTPAKKRSTSKRTPRRKTPARKPSSKANKGTKRAKTYSNTPKKKSTRDDYITRDDLRKVEEGFKKTQQKFDEVKAQFNRGMKKKADEHKAKKRAKKEERDKAFIEDYNSKLNLKKDKDGMIDTTESKSDIVKIEPSPLDRSERTKKKRFKFW